METRTKEFVGQAKNVAQEAQQTIKETAQEFGEKARNFGSSVKQSAQSAYQTAQSKVKAGAQVADESIRAHPYNALGIAFAAGILIGFLIKRK